MGHLAEDVERAALEDLLQAATPEIVTDLGIKCILTGSAFVSIASALPSSAIVINRAIGVGFPTAVTKDDVREIIEAYREAEVGRYFIQLHPDAQPTQLADWLLSFGLEPARGWQKFSRGRETVAKAKSSLSVREVGAEHAAAFSAIVTDAFDLGDVARPWLERLSLRDKWHTFMNFDGDAPAGSGALFLDGDVGWTDFGATAPDFRRRGGQSVLLFHRVQFALDHGCKQVFTCTGEEVPGDPQASGGVGAISAAHLTSPKMV